MPSSVEILTIPLGSALTSTINKRTNPPEPDSKNDFPVLFLFSENVNLTESGITVSAGATLVSLEGANSVWMGWVRPPQTAGTVRVTVLANAVSQGNPVTSKDIRVSTGFPDADAETPSLLFSSSELNAAIGLAVSPTRIIANRGTETTANIAFFTHAGVYQNSETLTARIAGANRRIDYFNQTLLMAGNQFYRAAARFSLSDLSQIESYSISRNINLIAHTRFGIIAIGSNILYTQPYGTTASADRIQHALAGQFNYRNIAHQDDLLYMADRGFTTNIYALAEVSEEDGLIYRGKLNINRPSGGLRDIAIYRNTFYMLGVNNGNIYTLDIRKYRPIAKNTKKTIYPVFVEEGGTLDLKQFSSDAERIVFDVGYDKQPQLSINASNELAVGSGAQTCLVKLKAINRIDATETESFQFYLIIRRAAAPVWKKVSALTMRAGSRYDLFQLVDAESIVFRSGRTRPADSSLSNGVFTVGSVGGVAEFTARKGALSTHIAIAIDVVQGMAQISRSITGYRVEIAGIDVTADVLEFPSVSETLDPVVINEYRVNEASVTLRNEGGKYNSNLAGNFWETHGLNAGGFQNSVKIWTEHDGPTENLFFSGVINESVEPIKDATFKLNCTDISSRLRKALAEDFGTLEKWDALRKQSDEDSYAGIYVPERSLVPMQVGTGVARSDRTDLTISRLELPSEGPTPENTGYMTPTEFRTAGGFLPENPLLRFMAEHLSEDVRFLINQLAINKEVYNTEIDIPGVTVEAPFLLNRGSVAFSVESTRMTRLPVDWVHDPTNNRILILLSNAERHISDLLVQYNVKDDSYRVLHEFDKSISVHRIARRSGTNYYILTSSKIRQDRSARQLPRQTDSTGYAYDSLAEGSAIKIYHFGLGNPTPTLRALVAEDNSFPPQLGIHYYVGFENALYIDEFEGILPSPYSAFKVLGNNLYYRYAKDGEFGVARVNTGGTTTEMIKETNLGFHNHLNFAFDVNTQGTLYFVYATGNENESMLTIKRRTSGGTETTVLSETRGIGAFNELGFDFGAFLGVHEVLFHNGTLYMVAVIQKADLGDGTRSIVNPDVNIEQRTAEKSGERNVTTRTNLNPSNLTLAPGNDIPLRIDFDGSVSGATQDDLTVYGGRIQSFNISSDMIDVTIRPDSQTHHKNIIIDLAEDAVDQGNEAWRIVLDFGTKRSRGKAAGAVLYRVATNAANPSLEVLDKWDFAHQAGCNLTVHDGAVHYLERPRAATVFKPINPDL
jgi:hypothetical protein